MEALLSAEELAKAAGVPLQTVYMWNHKRSGPTFIKVGRHVRYREADVQDWLERHESEATV